MTASVRSPKESFAALAGRTITGAPLEHISSEIVSYDSEPLVLVDTSDQIVGHLDKSSCHDGEGVLHRAFSLFIFNARGELLMQRRHASKRLWPGFWSNSCCSHPRQGETMEDAVQRRCEQELGFRTPLHYLYKFEYHARFGDLGSEHELCSVYVGNFDGEPEFNNTEISEIRWISAADLDAALEQTPDQFTPWFKIEWQRLRGEFGDQLP